MNIVNRVVMVVGLLLTIPLCVVLLVAPIPVLNAVGEWTAQTVQWLNTIAAPLRFLLGIVFALVWLLLAALLLWLELRRPPRRMVRVTRVDGGQVEISLNAIDEHITYELEQLPGVLRVRPRSRAQRNAVAVEVDVETAGDRDVPDQATRILETIQRTLEEKIGVRMAQPPQIRLRSSPAPAVPRRPAGG
ncbi:MAG: alkaline shock response membrane anchor protein AmaP [Anaerolineae bacterium]|nr:alkaline shock response membrane anchor protein AmaP [Anaerolineae bacterium]MCX8067082.1 alkaline shock response membrane anchor protein AmaP [Anaerolineae bacterium]MDW7990709.1 alkaline shock response membrane anchor protein AmaP [Anaerolineae bacterium]